MHNKYNGSLQIQMGLGRRVSVRRTRTKVKKGSQSRCSGKAIEHYLLFSGMVREGENSDEGRVGWERGERAERRERKEKVGAGRKGKGLIKKGMVGKMRGRKEER